MNPGERVVACEPEPDPRLLPNREAIALLSRFAPVRLGQHDPDLVVERVRTDPGFERERLTLGEGEVVSDDHTLGAGKLNRPIATAHEPRNPVPDGTLVLLVLPRVIAGGIERSRPAELTQAPVRERAIGQHDLGIRHLVFGSRCCSARLRCSAERRCPAILGIGR